MVDQPEKKSWAKNLVSLVVAVGQEIVTSGLIRQPLKKWEKTAIKALSTFLKLMIQKY